MSYSSKVKYEAAEEFGKARHCLIAELASIILFCGNITETRVRVRSENELVIIKFIKLVLRLFGHTCEKEFGENILRGATISDGLIAEKALLATGLTSGKDVSPVTVKNECCKRAFIRGAFLAVGSINSPSKSYHLEFTPDSELSAAKLSETINFFGLNSRVVKRKNHFVVYLKEAEQIMDILRIIGSHKSLLEYENYRVSKDFNNYINRRVNFSGANDNKSIIAAVNQTNDIVCIRDTAGFDALPPGLMEIAALRLEYPEISLSELGERLNPPLTKSGVSHRLRKLQELSERLRTAPLDD